MNEPVAAGSPLTVMTVNTHKGFTFLNRKFILPELRDAVRKVGADVVFMQEVLGVHVAQGKNGKLSKKFSGWTDAAMTKPGAASITLRAPRSAPAPKFLWRSRRSAPNISSSARA